MGSGPLPGVTTAKSLSKPGTMWLARCQTLGRRDLPIPKIILRGDSRLAAFPPRPGLEARPLTVGWREWLELPDLGIARIMAKIDTGARTSALHAGSIEPFEVEGQPFVRFDVTGEGHRAPWHEAPVADRRSVRSSNGGTEERLVIRTRLMLGPESWVAEVSLTKRDSMDLPMLIGREALAGWALVDPAQSWLWGQPRAEPRPRRRRGGPALKTTDSGVEQ